MARQLVRCARLLATLLIVVAACWASEVQVALRSLLLVPAFIGLALAVWAMRLNPEGGKVGPAPIPSVPVRSGPYRFTRHPMYLGQSMAVVFFMWYSAGFWAAFSIALIAEIMFREYIWREEGSRSPNSGSLAIADRERFGS